MAFGRFLKKILGGASAPQRHYDESDEEIQLLWRDRGRLNAAEVGQLLLEFAVRGLPIKAPRPLPARPNVGPTMLPQTLMDTSIELTGGVIEVDAGARVVVTLPSGMTIGVQLPTWWPQDASPSTSGRWSEVDETIDWQHVVPGYAQDWDEHGVSASAVQASSDEPPTLRITDGDVRVLVGPSIPLGLIASDEGRPSHVAGSLAPPTADEFKAAQEAWSADVSDGLLGAWVVADAAGAAPLWSQAMLETLGFATFFCASRLPCGPPLQPIVRAAIEDDGGALRDALSQTEEPAIAALAAAGWVLVGQADDLDGAVARAEAIIGAAAQVAADAPELLFARGELAWCANDTRLAAKHYRAAADAGYGRGWVNLAALKALAGDLDDAQECIDKAVESLTDKVEHAETGDVTEELHHPAALHLQTTLQWARGFRDEAFATMQRALPEQTPWVASHLEALVDEGRPGQDPMPVHSVRMGVQEALVAAAYLVHRNGSEAARGLASNLLSVVVARQHLPFEAEALRADLKVAQGDVGAAVDGLQEALEWAPHSSELYAVLGEIAVAADRPSVGTKAWRRAFELAPEDTWLRSNAAIVATCLGELDEAKSLLDALSSDMTDSRLIAALRYHLEQRTG